MDTVQPAVDAMEYILYIYAVDAYFIIYIYIFIGVIAHFGSGNAIACMLQYQWGGPGRDFGNIHVVAKSI